MNVQLWRPAPEPLCLLAPEPFTQAFGERQQFKKNGERVHDLLMRIASF
jgi:hypothetical protein